MKIQVTSSRPLSHLQIFLSVLSLQVLHQPYNIFYTSVQTSYRLFRSSDSTERSIWNEELLLFDSVPIKSLNLCCLPYFFEFMAQMSNL